MNLRHHIIAAQTLGPATRKTNGTTAGAIVPIQGITPVVLASDHATPSAVSPFPSASLPGVPVNSAGNAVEGGYRLGADWTITFVFGAWTDGVHVFTIYEYDAAGVATQVAAASLDAEAGLLNTDGTLTVSDATRNGLVKRVTYIGANAPGKKLRVDWGISGAPATGLLMGAVLIEVNSLDAMGRALDLSPARTF
jgi:hypothetical protein